MNSRSHDLTEMSLPIIAAMWIKYTLWDLIKVVFIFSLFSMWMSSNDCGWEAELNWMSCRIDSKWNRFQMIAQMSPMMQFHIHIHLLSDPKHYKLWLPAWGILGKLRWDLNPEKWDYLIYILPLIVYGSSTLPATWSGSHFRLQKEFCLYCCCLPSCSWMYLERARETREAKRSSRWSPTGRLDGRPMVFHQFSQNPWAWMNALRDKWGSLFTLYHAHLCTCFYALFSFHRGETSTARLWSHEIRS